jgi:hypothetical protein
MHAANLFHPNVTAGMVCYFRFGSFGGVTNSITLFRPCDGVSPIRRAAPRSQPFLAAADDAQARRPPPSRGIQLLSEEVPRLSSKVLSRNFKFRSCAGRQEYASYAIHLAQIGRTFREDIAEQEREQKVE